MTNFIFDGYQWEAIWLVTLIMSYKESLDSEYQSHEDDKLREMIVDTNKSIKSLDEKLNLVLERLDKIEKL